MRQILALTFLEIKRLFVKPSSYILMFGMPLLFTMIFGNLIGGGETEPINLGFVDVDHTTLSSSLQQKLGKQDLFKIEEMSEETAKEKVDVQEISGYFYVEQGFEDAVLNKNDPKVSFLHSPAFDSSGPIIQTLNDLLGQMNVSLTGANIVGDMNQGAGWEDTFKTINQQLPGADQPVFKMETISQDENKSKAVLSHSATGMSIMFVMFTMVSVTGVILEARKSGVWYRLMATPASKFQILGGYFIAFFLIGWIQFGILLVASRLIFGIDWGDPLGLFILISAILLFVVGLGLFLAGFVKTVEQQGAIGTLVIVSTCMLGGVYWPLEIVPKPMQQLAQFVPQTWAMKGFTEITIKGGTVSDIMMPVLILLLFAVILLGFGMRRIRFE